MPGQRALPIELEVRAKEVARRILWRQHHSEIIRDMGISQVQLNWIINDYPPFKQILATLERETYDDLDARHATEIADIQQKAREASGDAMDKLIGLMKDAVSQDLQRASANDVIKYSGAIKTHEDRPILKINNAQLNVLVQAVKEDDSRSRTIE
jgi:hypothetical protein